MKKIIFSLTAAALVMAVSVPAFAAWSGPEEKLDTKTAILQQRVAEGVITQEQADEIIEEIQERMANCDGERSEVRERMGEKHPGLGFGRMGERGTGRNPKMHGQRNR